MFCDKARIILRSGKGGDGHVSFRREKYVPSGGPDGGDGGKGGDVYFEVDPGMNTLNDFRHKRKWAAGNGEEGGKKNRHGKKGEDLVVKVPEGTILRDAETGKVIMDMSGPHKRELILPGGRGGVGNQHFATSRMQAPKYAKPGGEAVELEVVLELKVLADVGLVGFPSVGKSTLLSRISNAKPEIAAYPFTTLHPILGVVDLGDGNGFVCADIPGLIEGASRGAGLGHEFLRHIERTRVLIHLVDIASVEGRDPIEDIQTIEQELASFDEELPKKPVVLAANKSDLLPEEDPVREKLRAFADRRKAPLYFISAATGQGIKELLGGVSDLLSRVKEKAPAVYEQEFFINRKEDETEEGFTVGRADDGAFTVEGPKIERMLGYTNLESERGFLFFQKFLKEQGIIKELEKLGMEEGDTVRLYALEFEYLKDE